MCTERRRVCALPHPPRGCTPARPSGPRRCSRVVGRARPPRVGAFHASPRDCPAVIHFVELEYSKRNLLFLMLALLWASILLLLLLLSTTTPKSQQGCPGHVSPSISMCHPHPARCLAKVCEGKKHRTKVRTHVPSRLRLTSTRATWIPSLNQGANQPVRLAFRKDSETGFRPKFQPYQICCLKVAKGWF